ncbi:MAG: hypothetical protein JKY15_03040, partial [Deltaproteobacteria bacterium]|nr:hypothetical protein [Deltaproteobacteria bacterium]
MRLLFLVTFLLSLSSYSESNQRLIIRFKEGVNSFASGTMYQSLGIKTNNKLDHFNSEVIELPKDISAEQAVKLFKKDPNVLYAEPDFFIQINPIESKDDDKDDDKDNDKDGDKKPELSNYDKQWALHNEGQKVGKSKEGKIDADINGTESWEYSKGDRKVVLGIIDTGVYYKHIDLKPN